MYKGLKASDTIGNDNEELHMEKEDAKAKWRKMMLSRLDALVFWLCSARYVSDFNTLFNLH